jgi:hypothetical protein
MTSSRTKKRRSLTCSANKFKRLKLNVAGMSGQENLLMVLIYSKRNVSHKEPRELKN